MLPSFLPSLAFNIANIGRNFLNPEKYDYVWTIDEPNPIHGDPISDQGVLTNYDRRGTATAILYKVLQCHNGNHGHLNNSDKEIVDILRNKTLNFD